MTTHGRSVRRLILAPLEQQLDAMAQRLMQPGAGPGLDFSRPIGEEALVPPDSLSWRIFKNPVSLFVGGVAAVILELAEPAVRSGVWQHSSFRKEPVKRLQRTGLAAMVTVYGPRSSAEKMIAGVVRRHDAVTGETPGGQTYRANDVELLDWVQATATFGFAQAYSRYVEHLGDDRLSQAFAEAGPAARLYGATGAPASRAEWRALLQRMEARLEPSPIVLEFLDIMQDAPAMPRPMRPLQRLMVHGAVEIVPHRVRLRLGLGGRHGLRPGEELLLRQAAALADRLILRSSPAVQSCLRLGLPKDYLYLPFRISVAS